jgi:hypothetical protein
MKATKTLSNKVERQPSTTTLSDAYPNDFVVQYMMPTTVSKFIKFVTQANFSADFADCYQPRALLGIFAFLFISYKSCIIWSEANVCASRVSYMAHGVGVGLSALTAYTYFLKRKLSRRGKSSPVTDDV